MSDMKLWMLYLNDSGYTIEQKFFWATEENAKKFGSIYRQKHPQWRLVEKVAPTIDDTAVSAYESASSQRESAYREKALLDAKIKELDAMIKTIERGS